MSVNCTYALVGTIVTCVITCCGWYVTHTQAKSRELRKETRAIIDNFNEVLDKLLEATNGYYGSKASESQEISKLAIHSHISRLSGIIDVLEKIDTTLKLNQKFVPLYEAITGNDFESASLKLGHDYSEKCKRIILLTNNIRQECENWYKSYYEDNKKSN